MFRQLDPTAQLNLRRIWVPELGVIPRIPTVAVSFKGWYGVSSTSCPWGALHLSTLKEMLCLPGFLRNYPDEDTERNFWVNGSGPLLT